MFLGWLFWQELPPNPCARSRKTKNRGLEGKIVDLGTIHSSGRILAKSKPQVIAMCLFTLASKFPQSCPKMRSQVDYFAMEGPFLGFGPLFLASGGRSVMEWAVFGRYAG